MAKDFANRQSLAAHQLQQLRALLRALLPSNRFYAAKLGDLKEVSSLKEFAEKVPFTFKSELTADQQRHPIFGSNLTFPLQNYTRFHQTSGTTGIPIRWLDTPESWSGMVDSWAEILRVAGVTATDKIYYAFSFGPFIGFWLAFDAGQKIGALCIPGGGLNSGSRLKAILENKVTVLCCTPTYALHLAGVARNENVDLSRAHVRKIIVAGEPGGSIPATRERLEALWPTAQVFDHHGMTEVGPVTYECPVQPGVLHVIESAYLPEIIDPQTGVSLPAGKKGELVLTTLQRTASPLLRYRTGDLVCSAETVPCRCGRFDLALTGGILGRADDMIIIRGVNIFPSAIEEVLRRFDEIDEYQALIKTEDTLLELSIRIECKSDVTDSTPVARKVAQQLQATFNLRIPVETVPPGTLPRFEMKAKRWIRH